MDADDNKVAGGMWGRRGKWADDVWGGGCRRGEQVRMSTDGNAPGLAVPHRAVNSRFVRADSVIRRGEYAVNPAMGAIRQPGEYVANTWRISDVVVAATTVTGVATTRGDRDSNCDRGDGSRHSSHSHCHLVTVVAV